MTYIIALLVMLADQYTKKLAVSRLVDKSVPVIKDVFHLTYVENSGAAFGMFKNGNTFLMITSSIILIAVISTLAIKKPKSKLVLVGGGLIIGGAFGNLLDRIFRGFVVDFFDFRLINYPVFNIADSCVVVGAVLVCVYIIFFDNKVSSATNVR